MNNMTKKPFGAVMLDIALQIRFVYHDKPIRPLI